MSKFAKAANRPKRLKMLLFGTAGTGKTITALQMPDPAVIDTERGCDWYTDAFPDMGILQTSDTDVVREAIKDIIDDSEGYKTLVLDSFTKFEEGIEERHLNDKKIEKANPHYTLKFSDYKFIKNAITSTILDLIAVDLNLVCTAGEKPIYDNDKKEDFVAPIVGYCPKIRAEVVHLFDVVIHLTMDKDGNRVAHVHKDRTNTLPKKIDNFDYKKIVEHFGEEHLMREPVQLNTVANIQQTRNRTVGVTFGGKDIKTAGATSEQLEAYAKLTKDMDKPALKKKLLEDYGQDSILDLREDEAALLLKDLKGELTTDGD